MRILGSPKQLNFNSPHNTTWILPKIRVSLAILPKEQLGLTLSFNYPSVLATPLSISHMLIGHINNKFHPQISYLCSFLENLRRMCCRMKKNNIRSYILRKNRYRLLLGLTCVGVYSLHLFFCWLLYFL